VFLHKRLYYDSVVNNARCNANTRMMHQNGYILTAQTNNPAHQRLISKSLMCGVIFLIIRRQARRLQRVVVSALFKKVEL